MQRMGAASRNTVGEIRSYGDEGGHFQITNFSAAIVGGTNTMFTVPVAKSGRYIFEGLFFSRIPSPRRSRWPSA
jgi:hypothetical protein